MCLCSCLLTRNGYSSETAKQVLLVQSLHAIQSLTHSTIANIIQYGNAMLYRVIHRMILYLWQCHRDDGAQYSKEEEGEGNDIQ